MPSTKTISTRAHTILGRSAKRSARWVDWEAIEATKAAAREAGLVGELLQWAPRSGVSLTALAEAYVARYVQAYGLPQ